MRLYVLLRALTPSAIASAAAVSSSSTHNAWVRPVRRNVVFHHRRVQEFCGQCIWKGSIVCEARAQYLVRTYGDLTINEARETILGDCTTDDGKRPEEEISSIPLAAFCGTCMWNENMGLDCANRAAYLVNTYSLSEDKAKESVMETGRCIDPEFDMAAFDSDAEDTGSQQIDVQDDNGVGGASEGSENNGVVPTEAEGPSGEDGTDGKDIVVLVFCPQCMWQESNLSCEEKAKSMAEKDKELTLQRARIAILADCIDTDASNNPNPGGDSSPATGTTNNSSNEYMNTNIQGGDSSSLSVGAIVGICVAIILILIFIILAIILRQKKASKETDPKESTDRDLENPAPAAHVAATAVPMVDATPASNDMPQSRPVSPPTSQEKSPDVWVSVHKDDDMSVEKSLLTFDDDWSRDPVELKPDPSGSTLFVEETQLKAIAEKDMEGGDNDTNVSSVDDENDGEQTVDGDLYVAEVIDMNSISPDDTGGGRTDSMETEKMGNLELKSIDESGNEPLTCDADQKNQAGVDCDTTASERGASFGDGEQANIPKQQ